MVIDEKIQIEILNIIPPSLKCKVYFALQKRILTINPEMHCKMQKNTIQRIIKTILFSLKSCALSLQYKLAY